MKKFLLLATGMFGLQAYAQPTLDYNNSAPQPGEHFLITAAGYMPPGAGGAGTTWDFSTLSPLSTYVDAYDSASQGAYSNDFPDANILQTTPTNIAYLKTGVTGIELEGLFSLQTNALFTLDNSEKVMSFPFTYNSYYTDSFRALYSGNSRTGFDTAEADGYGTLILPGNISFQNVLRVKWLSYYVDTISGLVAYTHDVRYYYYKPGIHVPLLTIRDVSVTGAVTQSLQDSRYYSGTSTGVQYLVTEALNNVTVGPNPARDKITIYTRNNRGVTCRLLDMQGKTVQTDYHYANDFSKIDINLSGLHSGLYFLQLTNGRDVETRKIVVAP